MQTLRQKSKPFIVPIFIPHAGCPHRCVFCNQHSTTGRSETFPTLAAISDDIEHFLTYRRDRSRPTEISFYGGTFLGLPPEQIRSLLAAAADYVGQGRAEGIRFSTRPDTIDEQRLALIADFPVTTIEIGVQSLNDAVLRRARRGHTAEQTCRALALLRERPYRVGAQLMAGLPGDTEASALATARQLTGLDPDFVRIYPTVVLRGSELARWYDQGRYEPLTLEAAVALTAELYRIFARHAIPVVRMGLQAAAELSPRADLAAGPFHPAFGELVQSALWRDAVSRHIEQAHLNGEALVLEVHPRRLSQLKGNRDETVMALLERHGLDSIEVRADDAIADDVVYVNGREVRKA